MINSTIKTTFGALSRLLLELTIVAILFITLFLTVQFLWRDLLVASNQLFGKADDPNHRTVFIQIDDSFLGSDVALTMQFEQWGDLLTRIQEAKPAVILLDYQFSPHRFESILPGKADHFEKTLEKISQSGLLVLGLSPQKEGTQTTGFTLSGIEESALLKKGCIAFQGDFDQVIRDFHEYPDGQCPAGAQRAMAAVAANQLGATIKNAGLILSRGRDSIVSIPAGVLLQSPAPDKALQGAIVVVGSNFPFEDELMASHHSVLHVLHPKVKGGIVHALNTEALLENRVAWNNNPDLAHLLMIPGFILFVWARRRHAITRFLWSGVAGLLLLELVAVNRYLTYLDAIIPALFFLACAMLLTGKKIVQDLLLKQKIQYVLGGLLSPAVYRQCTDNPGLFFKTRRFENASVLVLDLKGYSQDAQNDQLETLFTRTNALLAASTRAVHNHGGCVERFRGDGLLAYFGAPLATNQPLDDAISSAMAILNLLKDPDQPVLNQFQHRVRFGISSGEVILGKVGDDQRFDIAVTGLAANRAAHLESMADPVKWPIVVDENSLRNSKLHWSGNRLPSCHPKHPTMNLIGLAMNQELKNSKPVM